MTGFISRFFQISALTVGITKNGEIISTRAMPRPGKPVSNTAASTAPSPTVTTRTAPTSTTVTISEEISAGSWNRKR